MTEYPEDFEVDAVIQFVVDHADVLRYSTVAAIARDFEYDLELLLGAIDG